MEWKSLVIIILVIVMSVFLTRVIRWFFKKSFISSADKLKVDRTSYRFFGNAASIIVWLVALGIIVSFIPKLKSLAITLFAGAGLFVAILGLAAQQAFSNIIGGIFIVIFRPFRVGDMIKVGTLDYGLVEDITLRHTIINNFENKRIIIPNSIISSETIINDSIGDVKVCRWIEVGISYDSDIDAALKIMQEEAERHPHNLDVRSEEPKKQYQPRVVARVLNFGDFSINLRAYAWCTDSLNAIQMHSDINRAIKKRFDAEGIEIPFPYRTVVFKKDLPANSIAQ